MTQSATPPSPVILQQLMTSMWAAQAIYVFARLELADALADRPRTSDELATQCGAHAPSIHRLLRALTSVGIVTSDGDQFALTDRGAYLRRDHPQSVRAAALVWGSPEVWGAWGDLFQSVQTGDAAFPRVNGADLFSYFSAHPEKGQTFNEFMARGGAARHLAVAASYDYSHAKTIVDLGGGDGGLLAAILKAYPAALGVLFDLPAGLTGAAVALQQAEVLERCSLVEGDFFLQVPENGDVYLLSRILHDWDDERAAAILQTCRRSMPKDARLLIAEIVLPTGVLSPWAAFNDLNMLIWTIGKERTEAEFARLLTDSGFRLIQVVPTDTGPSVLEAAPV